MKLQQFDEEFESKHPRADAGKFGDKPESEGASIPEIDDGNTKRITLWRAADDDNIVGSASFAAQQESAQAYLDNPGVGGDKFWKAEVEIDESSLLDLHDIDEEEAFTKVLDLIDLETHPGAIGLDEWIPRIADKLQDAGIEWVRVRESFPENTETYIFVGFDDPEMEEIETQFDEEFESKHPRADAGKFGDKPESTDDFVDPADDFSDLPEDTESERKSRAPKIPAKTTRLGKAIREVVGDDPWEIAGFHGVLKNVWQEWVDHGRAWSEAQSGLISNYVTTTTGGKTGRRVGRQLLVGLVRKTEDPDQIKGFDEMVRTAEESYPILLQGPPPESKTLPSTWKSEGMWKTRVPAGDSEETLFRALQYGQWEEPTIYDPKVIAEAVDVVNAMDTGEFDPGTDKTDKPDEETFDRYDLTSVPFSDAEYWITLYRRWRAGRDSRAAG